MSRQSAYKAEKISVKAEIEQIQKNLFLLDCKDRWTAADYRLRDELRDRLRQFA